MILTASFCADPGHDEVSKAAKLANTARREGVRMASSRMSRAITV
jgi:hypothetical protein